MSTFAAVDLGAQSGRVAVGTFDGKRLDVREVHRFENVPVREGGVLRWNLPALFGEVEAGLRAAGAVDAVAVDSWAVDFGIVDGAGEVVRQPVHYRDARRAAAFDRVLGEIPARELYDRTGIQLLPINTIFELAAMAEEGDPALDAANTLLLIPDLMHHRLCGARTSELTNATTTQCFDPRAGAWADDLVERIDIPVALLPEIVPPGTHIGRTADDAIVVAVGTHDTASAVAAVPFRQPGSAYVSAGTWSLVGLEVDRPQIDDATFAANLTNEGGVAGTTRLLRNVTGLWLVHECRRAWDAKYSFEGLVDLAEAAPAQGPLIEPNDPAFVEPGDMPARIRAFCARTGQPEPDEPGAVVRCILESLALKHAQTVELLGKVTGSASQEIHVVGGGARNDLLCRWTAEASGLPVIVGPEEATVVGNLLVQAIALGELGSLEEARDVVRASFAPVVHEPREDWTETRARFDELLAVSA